MPTRVEYKSALRSLDKDAHICLLYLEDLIDVRFKTALAAQTHTPQKVDLSKIESNLDSMQKQIDGLRPKVDAAHDLVKEHNGREKYLKKLAKNAEKMLEEIHQHFVELYKSGYYKEGQRRRIREAGLIKTKEGDTINEP